jgi:hypothetical protein
MMFNATFNNISCYIMAVSLLVEETRVPGENHLLVLFKTFMYLSDKKSFYTKYISVYLNNKTEIYLNCNEKNSNKTGLEYTSQT